MSSLAITYKIFLDAEDISQTRILSSASDVTDLVKHHPSPYISSAEIDNENDLDDFSVHFYVTGNITEETCAHPEDADMFIDDMADLLSAIAHMHSYLEMEGEFSIERDGKRKAFRFTSDSGEAYCEIHE